MKRVLIIGCPGSGKSTFARALQEITQLPLVHLDLLFWNADRSTVSREVFLERLETVMQKEQWIIDGNYSNTMEQRMRVCDTVFFLDYATEVCLDGVTSRRGQVRPDLPWLETGNDPDYGEFLDFIKNFATDRRPQLVRLLENYSEKNIYHFTSREQAQDYLDEIRTIREESEWNFKSNKK